MRNVLSIHYKVIISVFVERLNEKSRNTLNDVVYGPLKGKVEPFESFLISFLINKTTTKIIILQEILILSF